jgi:type I restriction enzyme S subunit
MAPTLGTKKLFRIEPGDLIFNIVFAWEGAVAVASSSDGGRVGSHRFLTCVPHAGVATAEFLHFHFLTSGGLQALGAASPGGAGRNRTLGLAALGKIMIPVPPFPQQLWFNNLLSRCNAVGIIQNNADADLDALLPAVLDRAFKGEL